MIRTHVKGHPQLLIVIVQLQDAVFLNVSLRRVTEDFPAHLDHKAHVVFLAMKVLKVRKDLRGKKVK